MDSKFWARSIFYLLFILVLSSLPLYAVIKDPAWEKYVSAQVESQNIAYELVEVKIEEEEISSLLDLNRRVQLRTIEQKSLRYYHLFLNHPERIVRSFGFSSFIQFSWTDEDESSLRKENKDYRKLTKKLEKMKKKLENHDDYSILSEKFILMSNTSEYQSLQQKFQKIPHEVEKILNQQVHNISYHEYQGRVQ